MTLWKISGDACGESGGGCTVVYAITEHGAGIPDVGQVLETATGGRYCWSRIDEVKRIGEFPMAWEQGRERSAHLDDLAEAMESLAVGV